MLNSIPEIYILPLKTSPTPFVYLNNSLECLYVNEAFYTFFHFTKNTQEPTSTIPNTINIDTASSQPEKLNIWSDGMDFLTLIPQPTWLKTSAKETFQNLLHEAKENTTAKLNWFFLDIFKQNQYINITLHYIIHEGQDLYACHIEKVDDHSNFIKRADYGIIQYRDFIESMPLFAHIWDENFNLLDCTEDVAELFDCEDKEAYLTNFLKFSPEYQPNGILSKDFAKEKLKQTIKEGKVQFEWTHLNPKTGDTIPCEITLSKVVKNGEVLVFAYLNDRRQHFRDQVEINKAYEMFQLMRDTMPIASFLFTPDYKMIDCNKEIGRLLKVSKEEYMENYRTFFPETQPDGINSFKKTQMLYNEAMNTGFARTEWIFIDKDGQEVPTDVTLHRINYRGQDMLAVFAKDLRETKAYIKQIQTHMQEQQTRDKLILDSLPIGAVYWDENGEIIDCNDTMLKLFKVPSLEYYKENFQKFIPTEETVGYANRASIPDLLKQTFANKFMRTEYMRLDNEQNPLFVEITAVCLEQNGKPFVAVYTVDLTEKKKNEKKILEESERIQMMFDMFPMSAKLWNNDLRILDCNMEAIRTLRYDSKEEYLQYANTLNPNSLPIERQHYQTFFEKVKETFETGYSRFEWTTKDKFKEEIPTEVTCFRVKRDNDFAVISYLRDLREQKKMLENIRATTERMKLMFNTFPMGANFWNKDLQIIDCNLEVVKLSGFETKEAYLDWVQELMKHPAEGNNAGFDTTIFSTVEKAFASGYEQLEWVTTHKDGYNIPVERTFIREQNENGEDVIIGYMRDLREQKKMMQEIVLAQEDLRATKEIAERNANIKSEFLAHMSHEIRTPMNGVIGLLHLLLALELHGKQLEYAEKTLASAQHLLRVVNDILDLSSIEKGKLKMEKEAFTIATVCQEVENLFKPKANEKNLSFTITQSETTKGKLYGDAFRLKQVLFNLTSNAIKFTDCGSIQIDIDCSANTETQKTLVFKVTDSGIGLTEEQISKLFSAFSQAESFITRKYGGTGLGLLISKSIVEAMHGKIWVESEYGKSSTFIFTIICDLLAEEQSATRASMQQTQTIHKDTTQQNTATTQAKNTHTSGKPADSADSPAPLETTMKRVLLVEDNKINQLIAKELLKKHGYHTTLAENGQEALDMLEKETFDIILMDIQMPVMDGLTATKEIRKQSRFSTLPIIAVSAHTMEGDKEICFEHGMNDHVRKPISPPELFKAMDTCLASVE